MNTVDLSKDFSFIVIFSIILLLTIAFRIIIAKHSSGNFNRPLCSLALYLISACLLLCLISSKLGIYKIVTTGNPSETVSSFYDSIIAGNYETAYTFLNNSSSLGLENSLSDNQISDSAIENALQKSYSYSISENVVISGLNAKQRVNFTYLDLNKLEESISSRIDPILNKKIELLPRNDLYTDDGHYKKELMDEIYSEAVNDALKNVTDYYSTVSYDITLQYDRGKWYLNTNDDMIRGFSGGK